MKKANRAPKKGWSAETAAKMDGLVSDELPEGDAVKELREWVDCNVEWDSDGRDGRVDYDASPAKLVQYIDMVERDYVPRKRWSEAVRAMKAAQDRMKQARDERNDIARKLNSERKLHYEHEQKLEAERDEWKAKAEEYERIDQEAVEICEGCNLVDEWKAKAEGYAEALEKLGCSVLENGTVFTNDNLPAENDVRAEHVDANDANATQDTREKLEADVLNFCEHFFYVHMTERRYNELIKLLDRQAAITERELRGKIRTIRKQNKKYRKQISELTAECNDLRHEWHRVCNERMKMRRQLTSEKNNALDIGKQLGEAMAERDEYRKMAGKMLDAAQEIRRIADASMPEGAKAVM